MKNRLERYNSLTVSPESQHKHFEEIKSIENDPFGTKQCYPIGSYVSGLVR